jgi:hypothetical protein
MIVGKTRWAAVDTQENYQVGSTSCKGWLLQNGINFGIDGDVRHWLVIDGKNGSILL